MQTHVIPTAGGLAMTNGPMVEIIRNQTPVTMPPGRTAIEALRQMRDDGVRHVPVVEQQVVVGIVSRGDFRGLEHDRLDVETGFCERIA
jgi:CBS domain-containing protein